MTKHTYDMGLIGNPERVAPLGLVEECLRLIETTMDQSDAGLWEFRHIAQKHCYTYLFHWAGSHTARQVARSLGDTAMEARATPTTSARPKPPFSSAPFGT